jgi:hypothetical protein
MSEHCAICGCQLHRQSSYAKPTIEGGSHASEHHFVAERFFLDAPVIDAAHKPRAYFRRALGVTRASQQRFAMSVTKNFCTIR